MLRAVRIILQNSARGAVWPRSTKARRIGSRVCALAFAAAFSSAEISSPAAAQPTVRAVPTEEYPSIQSAIAAAINGDQVLVGPGVYYEAVRFLGKSIIVRSLGGPEVTTIDATGQEDSTVKFVNFEDRNAMLLGFTITGGTGEPFTTSDFSGGGILIRNSSPTIANCIVHGNTARATQCQIGGGGGAYCSNGAPIFVNCVFDSNAAEGAGCGGAINNVNAQTVIVNCTFYNNTAWRVGGVIGGAAVVNSIFRGNFGWPYGEGANIYLTTLVQSCLIEDLGALAGDGNFDADPQFQDPGSGNFRLRPESVAIDAGSNSLYMQYAAGVGLVRDIQSLPRFAADAAQLSQRLGNASFHLLEPRIDLGAFEHDVRQGDMDGDGDTDLTDARLLFLSFTGP